MLKHIYMYMLKLYVEKQTKKRYSSARPKEKSSPGAENGEQGGEWSEGCEFGLLTLPSGPRQASGGGQSVAPKERLAHVSRMKAGPCPDAQDNTRLSVMAPSWSPRKTRNPHPLDRKRIWTQARCSVQSRWLRRAPWQLRLVSWDFSLDGACSLPRSPPVPPPPRAGCLESAGTGFVSFNLPR